MPQRTSLGQNHPQALLADLIQALCDALQQELSALTQSQKETQDGMTHAESRAENDKDTRAIESSYLARGLAQRVAQLRQDLATASTWVPASAGQDAVRMGSCVRLLDEARDKSSLVWLAPVGAGLTLTVKGQRVTVLSPASPLGQALLGKLQDDELETPSPQGMRTWVIEELLF